MTDDEVQPTGPEEPAQSESLVDAANKAAERLEQATKAMAAENTRRERLEVERTLGGQTVTHTKPKEETPEEYAARIMRGDA